MLFMFISAALAWIVAVVFMFKARKAAVAKDQAGLMIAIRLSLLLFIASMGCIVTTQNMKVGNTIPFFAVCGLALVMTIKFVVDVFRPNAWPRNCRIQEMFPISVSNWTDETTTMLKGS